MVKGHVTICKIYKDGTQEIVLDEDNLTTNGLSYSLAEISMGAGSEYAEDFPPAYFQVGTDTIGYNTSLAISSHFYQLSAPFDWTDYGDETTLEVVKRYRGVLASCTDINVSPPSCSALLLTSSLLSSTLYSGVDEYFAVIPPEYISKIFMDSFEVEFTLDENSGNGKAITEVGLFSKNPKGLSQDSPLLIAYRKFTAITKTSDFSLVIRWSVGFLGVSNNVDNHDTGGYINPGPQIPGSSEEIS
tara:strand:+ start:20570 stop:21304 length:735 start_codon:yes stop_codon:yes gene_type:complete